MKIIFSLLCAGICFQAVQAQNDNSNSGRAIFFDGIDDYIDLGDIYDDVALPLTISAWVYVLPDENNVTQYPIFESQDNSATYNGFTFVTSTLPHIGFTIGDGKGGNHPAFRRSRAGYFNELGKWLYMTAVARSGNDLHTYLNGYDVSGEYQGTSSSPMNSYSPTEVAKIGYLFSNGLVFRFKGIMDEVRIWNRALSETEIRESMCRRLQTNEPGLIGYWNFDEISGDKVLDSSPNAFHGTLKGNPTRVFSGAPIGDESVFLYTTAWGGKSLAKDNLVVSNVATNPYGVHIYKVNSAPSQTAGLDVGAMQPPYYGVFLADDSQLNTFDLSVTGENVVCDFYNRKDNSVAQWSPSTTFSSIQQRIEIIPVIEPDLTVNLGPDLALCDQQSFVLKSDVEPDSKTFLWNTGETTPEIAVTKPGIYSLKVSGACKTGSDTIQVFFQNTPHAFSLGSDQATCSFEPRVLAVDTETDEFEISWHDGSSEKYFLADDFGTYWVQIKSACGVSVDSITFTQKRIEARAQYNFISPDSRDTLNQYFILDENLMGFTLNVFNRWGKPVYQSSNYSNDWDGRDLPAGVYFYTVQGECFNQYKGTLTIMR